ncbi:LuxR family transcriptional regulator [Xinfangfangia sp. D13-10-4-6]|uniref:LuxR family transcriptional regulator n=1 Tax=Pseudogemmobacter hezensis TaxID=2737662 RepID=UPI0015571946|nr:LuxR family transcriptional regulator [Pseudogemmobacter hezensis]NPD15634.1 LuxR family transcriptional regulator [Pseudogemmobacter hezensis]
MTCNTVLELLGQIACASSIDETWEIATSHFAGIGFARANYGFTRFRHLKTIGDPDDALFLSTMDQTYARRYFESGLFSRSPVFRWAERNSGLKTWKWVHDALAEGRLSPAEADLVRQNDSNGIRAGLTVSFPETSSRARGALGLIADQNLSHEDVEEIVRERHDEINAIANMMHLRIVQLPQLTKSRALSPRQREALEWVADGKTTQDVALLMGVSSAMVEKHLRLARDALAVETTAQAVAKGALLNMIFQNFPAPAAQAAR